MLRAWQRHVTLTVHLNVSKYLNTYWYKFNAEGYCVMGYHTILGWVGLGEEITLVALCDRNHRQTLGWWGTGIKHRLCLLSVPIHVVSRKCTEPLRHWKLSCSLLSQTVSYLLRIKYTYQIKTVWAKRGTFNLHVCLTEYQELKWTWLPLAHLYFRTFALHFLFWLRRILFLTITPSVGQNWGWFLAVLTT